VALAVAPVREPFVYADIADVASAALTEPGHSGQLYASAGAAGGDRTGAVPVWRRARGRNTPVMDGIPRSLGRAPCDFSEHVQRAAASGVWGG